MDQLVVTIQIVLGLAFIAAGAMHGLSAGATTVRPGMEWLQAVPPVALRTIAGLEALGGLALIVAAVTGTVWLAALAAFCLILLMLFAGAFHARRSGERQNIALNTILGVLAIVVLYANLV